MDVRSTVRNALGRDGAPLLFASEEVRWVAADLSFMVQDEVYIWM